MTKRTNNKYSKEFKQSVCEYYSNYTWRETAVHFDMPEDYNTSQLCTRWYKELGFLPKSAGRNPSPERMSSTKKRRAKASVFVRSGSYIWNGKVMGPIEFLPIKEQLHPMDTFYTVTEHKVGSTVKRNPIAKLFSRLI